MKKNLLKVVFVVFALAFSQFVSAQTAQPFYFMNYDMDADWFNLNNWEDLDGVALTVVPNSGTEEIVIADIVTLTGNVSVGSIWIDRGD